MTPSGTRLSGVYELQGNHSQSALTSSVRTIRRVFCCISFRVGGSSDSLLPSAAAACAASSACSHSAMQCSRRHAPQPRVLPMLHMQR